MTYATEHITQMLKSAREARGLSQRTLSAKAGVPQSHISKIENGAVDLRASSLTELAHALDLELMLVPRKSVSAVNAIVRSSAMGVVDEGARLASEELTRLQDSIAHLTQTYPTIPELAQLKRQAHELTHFQIPEPSLGVVQDAADAVQKFMYNIADIDSLSDPLVQISDLRNVLTHGIREWDEIKTVPPAYSLDEDDHG